MNTAESVPAEISDRFHSLSKPWQASYSMAHQLGVALGDWKYSIPKGKPWPIIIADSASTRLFVVGASLVMDDYVAQGRQVLEFQRRPTSKARVVPISMYHPDERKDWVLVGTSSDFRGANWQTRMICYVVGKAGRMN